MNPFFLFQAAACDCTDEEEHKTKPVISAESCVRKHLSFPRSKYKMLLNMLKLYFANSFFYR